MNQPQFQWAIPDSLQIPPDQLRMRLDFYNSSVVLTELGHNSQTTKVVSAMDIAHALASELAYGTPVLQSNVLRWMNTSAGEMFILWEEPRIRTVALLEEALKPPRRFTIPLPGIIFLCIKGKVPWVYAAKRRPIVLTDTVYQAPLCNVFSNGRVCAGSHTFPIWVDRQIESFWGSFFSPTADLDKRSRRYPDNVVKLWEYLDGKESFPMEDLEKWGSLGDLGDGGKT